MVQAGLGECGRKQVRSGKTPEHVAFGPGNDPDGEKRGRSTMNGAGASTDHFMHRTHGKPASGQLRVHLGDAERQDLILS
jgi:hypothetical protein